MRRAHHGMSKSTRVGSNGAKGTLFGLFWQKVRETTSINGNGERTKKLRGEKGLNGGSLQWLTVKLADNPFPPNSSQHEPEVRLKVPGNNWGHILLLFI